MGRTDQPHPSFADGRVGGPATRAWREGTLTRAKELEALSQWAARNGSPDGAEKLLDAVAVHLQAARDAALVRRRRPGDMSRLERAISNLDAAEGLLLSAAPPAYILGRLPGVLNAVQHNLEPEDSRRLHLEHVARRVGLCGLPRREGEPDVDPVDRLRVVDQERLAIAIASRAAGSEALRQQLRVRSFRNVLIVTIVVLTILAAALALLGLLSRTSLPLCFAPEESGQTVVVCPTAQSTLSPTDDGEPAPEDVDDAVERTAQPLDVLLVELIGLAAGAIAGAAAVRGIRVSSKPHGLPVAVAVLKLPTGALTAVLGLLLMRGQFIPGLSALDTSAQILAWALVFGYAQQLFTRLVDQQAHSVLESARGEYASPRERPTTRDLVPEGR